MKINYGKMAESRNMILSFCSSKKAENPNYKIVDVGGAAAGWSSGVSDLLIDYNPSNEHKNCLSADICTVEGWEKIEAYVVENGMFDFAICTHTLEDVYNPFLALQKFPKIAKAGIITMPSAKKEISKCESSEWGGYVHHRWIFDQKDGQMYVVPKLPIFDTILRLSKVSIPNFDVGDEIQYYWDSKSLIPYSMFMSGYHGPTATHVFNSCADFLNSILK